MNEINEDGSDHERSPIIFIMFSKSFKLIWSYYGADLHKWYLDEPDEFLSGPIQVAIDSNLNKVLSKYQTQKDEDVLEAFIEEIHSDVLITDEEIPKITPEQEIEAVKRLAEWRKQFPEE